jgi:hypothetical protein
MMSNIPPCRTCCTHLVGYLKTEHGRFLPRNAGRDLTRAAFVCCHCGRYSSMGNATLTAEQIDFDKGAEPRDLDLRAGSTIVLEEHR